MEIIAAVTLVDEDAENEKPSESRSKRLRPENKTLKASRGSKVLGRRRYPPLYLTRVSGEHPPAGSEAELRPKKGF